MSRMKKLTALTLAIFLGLTSGYQDTAAAEPYAARQEQSAKMPDETDTGIAAEEETGETQGTEEAQETEKSQETEEAQGIDEVQETEQEQEALVNYLIVDEPVVNTPGTQRIMTSIGDGSRKVESAQLTYRNTATGAVYEVQAADILDDFVMFSMEYSDESWNGTYELAELTYTIEGRAETVSFAEMGIDASFGINETVQTAPDDVLLTDEELEALAAETDMSIVTLDAGGNTSPQESIQEAMENVGCEAPESAGDLPARNAKGAGAADATGMSSLVVVLDPGHGGTDGGAQANGIVEKTVNLKIAQYCKAELEEYAGVTVYMTRSDDTYLTLAQRAQVAVDKKANVFISLHNNSNTSSAPCGANVYYPNSNYNATCGTTGQSLASIIESKLTDLGLASGGIHIRNSENGTKYPDGSLADYYGVIKRCKENGIPALIVEHAFISNANDAKNYLSTDEQLKKLGVADATAIAEYYGLNKGLGFTSIQSKSSTTMELSWTAVKDVTGYKIYRSISSGDGFSLVATISSAATTSWEDTGLTPGVTYYYKMRTYTQTSSGTKYGKYSSVAAGTTMIRPVITSVKSKSSKEMVISWDAETGSFNYEIYRATSQNGTYTKLTTLNGINRLNYSDTTVKAGKKYYYKIRAIGQIDNTTVYSDYSEPVAGRTAKVPTKLSVNSKSSTTLCISWTGDKNAAGYVITRASSAGGKYKKVGTVSDGSVCYYDDEGVNADQNYYYKVQSYNYNNDVKGYSGYSGSAYGKTLKATAITKIVSTSSTKQTISWKNIGGASGYIIYRSTKKSSGYKKIKTISSGNTTSYQVTGLTPGTMYYYKVKTKNKLNGITGYGSASGYHKARAPKQPVITVAGSTGTKIRVSWEKVASATGYDIYRSTSKKGTYKKIGTAKADATGFTDKKLKMTKKYYYKVEAKIKGYKATGTSGMSKAAAGYPVRSTGIVSASVNPTEQLEITWNKVKDVTGYQIYRGTEENGEYTLLETISGADTVSYTDTSAVFGTTYFYKLRLVNTYEGKTIYGTMSAPVKSVWITAPESVTVKAASGTQLDISWSAVSSAVSYAVYRSTELDGTYTQIGTVSAAQGTAFSDTTVTQNIIYYYKIKAVNANNISSEFSSAASGCAVAKPVLSHVGWNAVGTGIQLSWNPVPADITGYEIYRSSYTSPALQTRVAITQNTVFSDGSASFGETYYYRVRTYKTTVSGGKTTTEYGIYSDTVSTSPGDYRIMGSAGVTVAQMEAMYRASGKQYPASVYREKGAADIGAFCQIVYEECCVEGVRPEVVFAQICHETAYLQFGGQVKKEQCNFGGLGALDGGAGGATFADVRTGVRTQVQHMKAYASTDPLKQTCIDGRFSYINRGKAEYVQQLGKGNWATDTSYDVKLMTYINKIKSF